MNKPKYSDSPSILSSTNMSVHGDTDFGFLPIFILPGAAAVAAVESKSNLPDMEAINDFMRTTHIVNNSAFPIKDDFIVWYDQLGWFDKSLSQSTFDEARNRRNQFMLANVIGLQQKEQVKQVISQGIENEEMRGQGRRVTSGGVLPGDSRLDNVKNPDIENLQKQIDDANKPPLIPTWFKAGAIIAGLAGVGIGIATIVGKFNPAALAARFIK